MIDIGKISIPSDDTITTWKECVQTLNVVDADLLHQFKGGSNDEMLDTWEWITSGDIAVATDGSVEDHNGTHTMAPTVGSLSRRMETKQSRFMGECLDADLAAMEVSCVVFLLSSNFCVTANDTSNHKKRLWQVFMWTTKRQLTVFRTFRTKINQL